MPLISNEHCFCDCCNVRIRRFKNTDTLMLGLIQTIGDTTSYFCRPCFDSERYLKDHKDFQNYVKPDHLVGNKVEEK